MVLRNDGLFPLFPFRETIDFIKGGEWHLPPFPSASLLSIY